MKKNHLFAIVAGILSSSIANTFGYSIIMERYGKTYYGTYEDECKIKNKCKNKRAKQMPC